MSSLRRWVLWVAVVVCSGAFALGQTMELRAGDQPAVMASWTATPPGAGAGGLGWVRVTLYNREDRAHVVRVTVRTGRWSNFRTSFERLVEVDSSSQRVVDLPQSAHRDVEIVLEVDGGEEQIASLAGAEGILGILVVQERGDDSLDGLERLFDAQSEPASPRGRARRGSFSRGAQRLDETVVTRRAPDELPVSWSWLSGFDAIVLDADAAGVSGDVLGVVLDYARAGGLLLVLNADELAGEEGRDVARLYERARDRGNKIVPFGFGRLVTPPNGFDAGDVVRWAGKEGVLESLLQRHIGGPVPMALHRTLAIPGLGDVPLGAFFLLVLLFAVLVGPVNLWLLRRGRRPTYLVVTVPLLGLGFTVAILMWGMFREGFGVRGAMVTATVLDQRAHEAVSVGQRTLFAGIGPTQLEPRSDTYLFSSATEVSSRWARGPGFVSDVDRGTVAGELVPSRTVTGLATARVGTARPRVAFERGPGGAWQLVPADDLRPVAGTVVVLRDPDGDAFVGRFDDGVGLLQLETDDRAVSDAIKALTAPFDVETTVTSALQVETNRHSGFDGVADLANRLRLGDMPRGSYVMLAERPPAFDDLGLEVDWLEANHLVHGLCAEEDFRG